MDGRGALLVLLGLALSGCPLTTFEVDRSPGGGSGGSAGTSPGGSGAMATSGVGGGNVGGGGTTVEPQPEHDRYVILQGEELHRLAAFGVLANDRPIGLDVATFSALPGQRPPSFDADVDILEDGTFQFTPERRFFGLYGIKYTVVNADGVSADARVQVNVVPTDIDLDAVIEGIGGFVVNGAPGDALGASIDAAGDVNADGYGDIVIGAPDALSGAGSAYLVFGKDDFDALDVERLPARTSERRFVSFGGGLRDSLGVSVAGVGDVDLDGTDDLAIGAPGGSGRAYVVFTRDIAGHVSLFPEFEGFTLEGDMATVGVGRIVRGVGDVNADGSPDVLVSAANAGIGWIHVIFGTNLVAGEDMPRRGPVTEAAGLHLRAAAADDDFPLSAARAFDVNSDGFEEVFLASNSSFTLLLGGTSYPANAGEPRADGSSGGWSLARAGSSAPASVSSAGDVNDDKQVDVAYCEGVEFCRVVFGPPSTLASGWLIGGFASGSGLRVAGGGDVDGVGGDVDGDGLADLLFADREFAYIVYGKRTGHADVNVRSLGTAGFSIQAATGGAITSVAMVGDVNADGIGDYAIGDATANDGAGSVFIVFGVASQ